MKRKIIKKSISKLVLAGLAFGILPTYLFSSRLDTKRPKPASSTRKKAPTPPKIVPSPTKPITKKIIPQKPKPTPITPKNTTLKRFFTNWEQKKPTKAEIDTAIKHVKDTTERIKKMIAIITGITVGVTVAGIALGVAIAALSVAIAPIFSTATPAIVSYYHFLTGVHIWTGAATAVPATMPTLVDITVIKPAITLAAATKSAATPGIIAGLIIAIISGTTIPFGGILTAGLTATKLLDSVYLTKALNRIEKRYPGILTADQIAEIKKFHKTAFRGTISKAIVKGIRLKNAIIKTAETALKQHPKLAVILKKKIIPRTKKYIQTHWELENLEKTISNYKERQKHYEKIMRKTKPFSKEHMKASFNLISIKTSLKYANIKKRAKKLRNRIIKYNRKYRGINLMLARAIKTYKQEANAILEDLKTAMQKLAIESETILYEMTQDAAKKVRTDHKLTKLIGKDRVLKIVKKLIQRQKEVVDLNKLINIHNKARKAWSFSYQAKVNRRNKLVKKLKRDNKKYPGLFSYLKQPTIMYIKKVSEISEKYKKAF